MNSSTIAVTIDERLRFALFGIQSVMGAVFSGSEIEKVFSDVETDQVSEKNYSIFENKKEKVAGFVDEYEPETLTLSVFSKLVDQKKLEEIYENAGFEVFRKTQRDNQASQSTRKSRAD